MIRPLHDWLVIKLDQVPEKKEGIILVAARDQERQYSGVIVRTGPGQWLPGTPSKRRPLGVGEGERVHFFRENFETIQGKEIARIVSEVEPGMVMIRARDLLFVDDEADERFVLMQHDSLHLSDEQLARVPYSAAVPGAGLTEVEGTGRPPFIPRLSGPRSKHKTKPASEEDKVEERAVVLESDLVKLFLEDSA